MQTLLLWVFYITSFYAFIPGLVTRIFGFRVFRRGICEREFALTFDDGPDPIYTPLLLDLLKRYDMKATFFVVGSHAEKHPELLRRIHKEGHLIGIHNYIHKTNWLMHPKTVKMQLQRTHEIIHTATGEHPAFYRPPWGVLNFFDFSRNSGYRIVLWSAMFGDWRTSTGPKKLVQRMLRKLKGGEVMLLHDCGTTAGANPDAPANMLIALEQVLEEAKQRNLISVRVDDMIKADRKAKMEKVSPLKKAFVSLWLVWEKLFHAVFRLRTVTPADPMLHFRLRPYKGQTITLDGGAVLENGDQVIEIHFDNKKLYEMGTRSRSEMQLAIQMIRGVQQDLPTLANYVLSHEEYQNAKGLYAVTMITRGPEQFGFIVKELPDGLFATSTRLYLRLLMSVIHPQGKARVKEGKQRQVMEPKTLVMPMETLLERYAEKGNRSFRPVHREHDEQIESGSVPLPSAPQGLSS